ncbi:MAG: hypothetical protein V1689_14430 [Pseudomonadota bacterium]
MQHFETKAEDHEGLFSKGRNPNSSQPVVRPRSFKYSLCKAGERFLHRDILLRGCSVTSFKTSLPFFEVMPSFTSFGKKTLAVGHGTHHCFQSTKLLPNGKISQEALSRTGERWLGVHLTGSSH